MITAIAIDDEPPALKVINSFCNQVDFIDLQKTFNKPTEALDYLTKFPIDLLFLDIHMPSLSGIDFYKSVQQDTMVIFTTAHSQYAVEGFNLSAIDYLLKPYTSERFMQAVNKANDYYNYLHPTDKAEQSHIYIRADYSLIKINRSDILYIEGLDDYIKIHILGQKTVVARMTLKNMLEKLPQQEFSRVHRSFIVPFDKIEQVRGKNIKVAGQTIPIGTSYREAFLNQFNP